jgi:carboxyl-terminal processing protease
VQTLFPLQDGSGLYVTIAKYHTPSGFVIDHVGLSPDIVVEGAMDRELSKDQQLRAAEKELRRILTVPRP